MAVVLEVALSGAGSPNTCHDEIDGWDVGIVPAVIGLPARTF